MRVTFKVLFYVNRSKEKNGIVPIMGRVTINGTTAQFSCKRRGCVKIGTSSFSCLAIGSHDCVSQRRDRYCPYNSLVIACDFHSFTSEICADFQQLTSYSLEDSLGKSLVIARNFQPFPSDQIETLPFVSL